MRLSTILALMFSAGLSGGCAYPGFLVAGQSTEADVRARMGTPTETRTDSNGDKLLDYATGPEGFETHRIRIGADGRMKEVTQLLSEEQLTKIVPGKSTKTDVRALLGKPAHELVLYVGLTWDWRYRTRGGNQPGFLVVSFNPDDTVGATAYTIDPAGGDRSR